MTRLLFPLAVIAATNLVLVSGARWNRSGNPEAIVRLTERELRLPYMRSERNSAQELELVTSREDPRDGNWLNAAKLESLGFDTPRDRPQLSRQVFGAYEYEGLAWTRHVQRLEAQRTSQLARRSEPLAASQLAFIDRELTQGSRLFVVDASRDPAELRAKYPDRTRYLILPATIYAFREGHRVGGETQLWTAGDIRPVTSTLVVPVRLRGPLDRAAARGALDFSGIGPANAEPTGPRYAVRLAVGHRYEPWIAAVEDIDTTSSSH